MVDTWSGFIVDTTTRYQVFTEDRRGCVWDREGDDYGVRYAELQFESWWLDEDGVDEDGHMVLHFDGVDGGDHFSDDVYAEPADRLLSGGFPEFAMAWQDVLIRCEDAGTNSVAGDQVRQGSKAPASTNTGPVGP